MTNTIRMTASVSAITMFLAAVPAQAQDGPPAPEADRADSAIVVTGSRASLRRCIEPKRDSDVIAAVLRPADLGKFPAQNVAEALQRVTGIEANREFGEDRHV